MAVPIVIPYAVSSGGATTGDYRVRFFDFDGTLLKTAYCDSGGSVTPPAAPTHDYLSFDEWNYDSDALSNITSNLDVGATYYTTDGKSYLFVTRTAVNGLSTTLYFNKSDTSTLTIDWGDGGENSTNTSSGNINVAHTYTSYGNYVIKTWISSGSGTYKFGNGSGSTTVLGGTQGQINALTAIYMGNNITSVNTYAFCACYSLKHVVIPGNVTQIDSYAFTGCRALASIIIPQGVTSIGDLAFNTCYAAITISISDSVTTIGTSAFNECTSIDLFYMPTSVTSIGASAVTACYSLKKAYICKTSDTMFSSCYSLSTVYITGSETSIKTKAFYNCRSLTYVSISDNITSIASFAFYNCFSLSRITIPASVTSIAASAFGYARSLVEYIMNPTSPPTLSSTDAFTDINSICKIKVPSASLDAYKAATNWSAYADYMEAI